MRAHRGYCCDVLLDVYNDDDDDDEVEDVTLMIGLAVEAQFHVVIPCPISPRRATGQTRVASCARNYRCG